MLNLSKSYCNSFNTRCKEFKPSGYCLECSHAEWYGATTIKGKKYRWIFNPYFGPEFLNKNGKQSKRHYSEKHPVWARFEKWHTKHFTK